MIDEYVKIGMTAKMYLSVSVKGENDADRQPCICVGKIEKILSEHEVEIEVLHQSEESFSKKETYVMYFIAPLEACMCHVSCLASYHDEQKKILSFKILSLFLLKNLKNLLGFSIFNSFFISGISFIVS